MSKAINTTTSVLYQDEELSALTSHNSRGDPKEKLKKTSQTSINTIDSLIYDNKNIVSKHMLRLPTYSLDATIPFKFC